jgi:hypothetical protein
MFDVVAEVILALLDWVAARDRSYEMLRITPMIDRPADASD